MNIKYHIATGALVLAGLTTLYQTDKYLDNNQPTIAHNVARKLVEFDGKNIADIVKNPKVSEEFSQTLDLIPENVQPVYESIAKYQSSIKNNDLIKLGGMLGSAALIIGGAIVYFRGKDEDDRKDRESYAK